MSDNKSNHQCIICDKKYYVCVNCPKLFSAQEYETFNMSDYIQKNNIPEEQKNNMFLGYKSICDSMECYFTYMIIKQLKKAEITPSQARIELENLGYTINEVQKFKESVKNYLLENVFNLENNMVEEPLYIEKKEIVEEIEIEEESTAEISIQENTQPKYVNRRQKG